MTTPQLFTVGSNPVIYERLSPSGAVISNGQASSFYQNDGITSNATGRAWLYQGFTAGGGRVNVPGSAAGDVDGLGAGECPVVMQNVPGYQYDVRLDMQTYGTSGGFQAFILGRYKGAAAGTYAVVLAQNAQEITVVSGIGGSNLLRAIIDSSVLTSPIDQIKVQLQNSTTASSAFGYYPNECVVSVTEYIAP